MKRNTSYITRLLEASSTVEAYRVRQELEEKLRTGFKPDEIRDFVYELLEFVYDYKQLRKDIAVVHEFAELIAKYIPVRDEI
jgi:GTP1/Obg family GTP-binding protein